MATRLSNKALKKYRTATLYLYHSLHKYISRIYNLFFVGYFSGKSLCRQGKTQTTPKISKLASHSKKIQTFVTQISSPGQK